MPHDDSGLTAGRNPLPSRRRVLQTSGAVGVAGLAGCVTDVLGGGEEYPAQDITFITGGAGSLFDFWARATEEFLPEHVDADVVVENVPGGGGTTSANRLYTSDADGYTIGSFNIPGNSAGQMTLDVEYELGNVEWLGRLAMYPYVLFVDGDSEYESLEDLQEADGELQIPLTDVGSTASLTTVIANEILGIDDYSFITGHESGVDALQTVAQGNADFRYQIAPPVSDMVDGGDVRPLLALDETAPDTVPDTPTLSDVGSGEDVLPDFALQAFVGAPPDVDDDHLDVLRSGLEEAATSQEMENWADENQPLGSGFSYADHSTAAEIVAGIEADLAEYEDLLEERFVQE